MPSLDDERQIASSSASLQRKTTLKWQENGELSEIDMARILDRLNDAELTACDLTCEIEKSNRDYQI
tara:strand:+ start:1275 stop:1475 length:201 start_codon:yes stop_codon:yes gene_type:complete